MLRLTHPAEAEIQAFLRQQSQLAFTYREVGASRDAMVPFGYSVNARRTRLGSGEQVFAAAIAAARKWKVFDVSWVELFPRAVPLEPGQTFLVLARHLGLWSLNADRVVYVQENEIGAIKRFMFAVGTLPGHMESGEERFLIEWNRDDDSVWYDLLAFVRWRHPLARIASPMARSIVQRFARDSAAAMERAVSSLA